MEVGRGLGSPSRGLGLQALQILSPSNLEQSQGSTAWYVPTGFEVVVVEHLLGTYCMHGTLAQELENLALLCMRWQPILPVWTSFPSL